MGTVFIGVLHLLFDLFAVMIVTALTFYPDLVQVESDVVAEYLGVIRDQNSSAVTTVNGTVTDKSHGNMWDCDQKIMSVLLTLGSSLLTVALLYGVITGRPRFILPFFCLHVFDLSLTSLSFVSFFSFTPDIQAWIAAQKLMPFRDELYALGNDWLLVFFIVAVGIVLSIKAYSLIIVWTCYKYLVHCERPESHAEAPPSYTGASGGQTNDQSESISEDREVILPPKYEEIMQMSTALPPYAAVQTGYIPMTTSYVLMTSYAPLTTSHVATETGESGDVRRA